MKDDTMPLGGGIVSSFFIDLHFGGDNFVQFAP